MASYDTIYKASVGGSSFQLQKLRAVREKPIVEANLGCTGYDVSIEGEGWIEGTTQSDLATKLAATRTAFLISGQNITITGVNGVVVYQLLAARCRDSGPHVGFEMMETTRPLATAFRFSVVARKM